jgi:hypothetical protein
MFRIILSSKEKVVAPSALTQGDLLEIIGKN